MLALLNRTGDATRLQCRALREQVLAELNQRNNKVKSDKGTRAFS